MTRRELEAVIDNLPNLDSAIGKLGIPCFVFRGGQNKEEEVLLDTGEVVVGPCYVNGFVSDKEFKRALRMLLLPHAEQVTFVGVGIWHK